MTAQEWLMEHIVDNGPIWCYLVGLLWFSWRFFKEQRHERERTRFLMRELRALRSEIPPALCDIDSRLAALEARLRTREFSGLEVERRAAAVSGSSH